MHIPGVDTVVADTQSRDNLTLVSSLLPQASLEHIPSPIVEQLITTRPDWGSPTWIDLFIGSLTGGITDSTLISYTSGKKRYLEFCSHCHCRPLLVSEMRLLHFVAHLASAGLSYQTVRLYLSAVRHLQNTSPKTT